MTLATIRQIMREAQFARWERLRRLGALKFIMLYGVLGWGVPLCVLYVLVQIAPRSQRLPSLTDIIVYAAIWTLAGFFVGFALWRLFERQYRQAHERKIPEQT